MSEAPLECDRYELRDSLISVLSHHHHHENVIMRGEDDHSFQCSSMVDTAFELRKAFKVSVQRIEWLEQSARLSEEPPDESHGTAINGAIKDATNVAKAIHPKPNLEATGSIETVGDITHGDTTKFLNTALESRKANKQVKHLRSSAASYHSHAGRRNRERANKLRTDGGTKAAMKCVIAAKKKCRGKS